MINHYTSMRRFVLGFIIIIFTIVVSVWVLIGYSSYQIIKNPSIIGETMGKIKNGYDKTAH